MLSVILNPTTPRFVLLDHASMFCSKHGREFVSVILFFRFPLITLLALDNLLSLLIEVSQQRQ